MPPLEREAAGNGTGRQIWWGQQLLQRLVGQVLSCCIDGACLSLVLKLVVSVRALSTQ